MPPTMTLELLTPFFSQAIQVLFFSVVVAFVVVVFRGNYLSQETELDGEVQEKDNKEGGHRIVGTANQFSRQRFTALHQSQQ